MHVDIKYLAGMPYAIEAQGTDFNAVVYEVWRTAKELGEGVSVLFNNILFKIYPEPEISEVISSAAMAFETEVVQKIHPTFIETLKQANQPLDYAKDNCFIISSLKGCEAKFFHPGQVRYISSKDRECPRGGIGFDCH